MNVYYWSYNKALDVVSSTDFYAFGSVMPGRNSSSEEYRYGMNKQESDKEISGTWGTHYSAMFWEYDARLGRRWNLDPKPQVSISDYACFANNPIWFSDPLGDKVRIKGGASRNWVGTFFRVAYDYFTDKGFRKRRNSERKDNTK